MKKKLLLLPSLLYLQVSFAAVITVSLDPNKPAQFNNVVSAFNAAAPGDTLYVYGSSGNYGNLTINKSITIIGAGYNTRKEQFMTTRLGTITLHNVSNVQLQGLTMNFLEFGHNLPDSAIYDNINIKYCHIHGTMLGPLVCQARYSNWTIQNSVIGNMTLRTVSCPGGMAPITFGVVVKNSVIKALQQTHDIQFVNAIIGHPSPTFNDFSFNVNNSFHNCMFLKMSFDQSSNTANNIFFNSLTHQTVNPNANFDLNWGTNIASGTIVNQNPLFVNNMPSDAVMFNVPLLTGLNWDPALQAGSPAINAGTDNTDIGLTGGLTPYAYRGEPDIPVVRRIKITNPIIPVNGTLNVSATATKPNQ